jgi:hypothetical protein
VKKSVDGDDAWPSRRRWQRASGLAVWASRQRQDSTRVYRICARSRALCSSYPAHEELTKDRERTVLCLWQRAAMSKERCRTELVGVDDDGEFGQEFLRFRRPFLGAIMPSGIWGCKAKRGEARFK